MAGNKIPSPQNRRIRNRVLPHDAYTDLLALRDEVNYLAQRTNKRARKAPQAVVSRAAISLCLSHMVDRLTRVLGKCGSQEETEVLRGSKAKHG